MGQRPRRERDCSPLLRILIDNAAVDDDDNCGDLWPMKRTKSALCEAYFRQKRSGVVEMWRGMRLHFAKLLLDIKKKGKYVCVAVKWYGYTPPALLA